MTTEAMSTPAAVAPHPLPGAGMPQMNLPARLDALAQIVRIGSTRITRDGRTGGFSPELISDSEALLRRAGERLRLSASHTVVALAGGTGSGKSSLFNALSGANFSPAGVTRPTTRHVHACVWGMQGAAPLLDWLGVQRRHRYGRASALDAGEAALTGLLLLDLPDHDSVVTASMAAVDRLSKLADMLIWVLDPQKYADAAVHRRYLIPLAGHASVITVVLNQIDLLSPDQISDCESDLRRLLDSEGLADTHLLPVSARTGAGLDELRAVLVKAVSARQAASERIAADIDAVLGGFAVHAARPAAPGREQAEAVTPDPGMFPAPAGRDGHAAAADGADAADSADSADGEIPGAVAGSMTGVAAAGHAAEQDPAPASPPWESARPPWEDAALDGTGGADGTDAIDGAGGAGDSAGGDGEPAEAWAGDRGGDAVWETAQDHRASAPSRPPWDDATLDGGHQDTAEPDPVASVPPGPAAKLTEAFARAAGLSAVTDALQAMREAQAVRYVEWPLARLARWRHGRDPVRGLRASGADRDARSIAAAVAGQAQQSDIDNAITVFADEVGGPLPEPWSRTVRDAARSGTADARAALGAAVREALPSGAGMTGWWRLIRFWQWLLIALAVAGLAWIGVIAALAGHKHSSALVSDSSLIPWLAVMVVAILLLGWLTSSGCQNMVLLAADRERDKADQLMQARVGEVARDLVLLPAGREIAEYERFRRELAIARGGNHPA